jgi:hypothetical protein
MATNKRPPIVTTTAPKDNEGEGTNTETTEPSSTAPAAKTLTVLAKVRIRNSYQGIDFWPGQPVKAVIDSYNQAQIDAGLLEIVEEAEEAEEAEVEE